MKREDIKESIQIGLFLAFPLIILILSMLGEADIPIISLVLTILGVVILIVLLLPVWGTLLGWGIMFCAWVGVILKSLFEDRKD